MKQKLFTLLSFFTLVISQSKAQSGYTLSGHISDALGPVTIYFEDSSFAQYFSFQTASNGDFQQTIVGSTHCYLYFYSCTGAAIDTALYANGNTAVWNTSYCDTMPCYVSYTTTYDAGTNTFYLQIDSNSTSGYGVLWNWGDGSSDSGLFVSHTYSANAVYNVCVNLLSTDFFGNIISLCSYCHGIGFDSTGNVVYRAEAQNFYIQVIQAGTLGIKNPKPENSLMVYPNPVANNLSLKIMSVASADCEIKLVNVLGETVSSYQSKVNAGENQFNFNTSHLQSGSYFITVKYGNNFLTEKFVK